MAAVPARAQNSYTNTVLVASDASYSPLIMVDPLLSNAWGIAIRPPGAGGHFWTSNFNSGTTTVYVGDVHGSDGSFTPLHQDELQVVAIAPGAGKNHDGQPSAPVPMPTGQVYNHSSKDFVVSGEGITGASKFLFVTGEGTISGWTETKTPEGRPLRQTRSVVMVDQSQEYYDDRLRFTGCAITDFPEHNRLYVTNWIDNRVEVYDHTFKRLPLSADKFRYPGMPDAYNVYNIQYFHTGPDNEGRLWVVYAMREEAWEEDPDFGAVAEFDLEGNFVRRLTISLDKDPAADSELKAPWGLAIAPRDFGPLSGAMLVANFGDGSIAGFDLKTGGFVDYLRDERGEPLMVDGLWGLTFGNGVKLGDANALYYAAGPEGESGGTFGSIRYTPTTCPRITEQPLARGVVEGDLAVFKVTAPSPVRLQYRWQRQDATGEWSDLSADGTMAGVDTAQLTISHAQLKDAVSYRCIITNACGTATSDTARLGVLTPDFDGDGKPGTAADIQAFLRAVTGRSVAGRTARGEERLLDLDGDGAAGTDEDINAFFKLLAGHWS